MSNHTRMVTVDNHTSEVSPKRCTRCGEEFPATKQHFHSNKSARDGLNYTCKSCSSANQRQRYARDIEASRKANRESAHKSYWANVEQRRQSSRERQRVRSQEARETSARWHEINRDAVNARKREKYHLNIKAVRERRRKRYAENREAERARERRKRQANPEAGRARTALRRARKRNAGGAYTSADVVLQLKSQKGKCWHCGKKLGDKYHADHLIPLTRGGSNDARNIVISCPFCNQSKNNKLPHEWNGRLL